MNIRTLKAEDLQELVELYSHLNPDDPATDADTMSLVWEQTEASGTVEYIGLYIRTKLVSSCQKVVVPNLTRSGQPYCLLENVVTLTDYRNRGYGKQLLKHTIEQAWSEGCYKVMLMSGRKEDSIVQFYRRAGFSENEKRAFIVRRDSA
ncbi:hypothetical protein AB833_03400 [Chromatiales bacterium (ex Bugula neritina AB1)]|nr:hypothetical protein AB833_03400 [Chromatiales bacterium (ex Bugula neritina AB1)]